MCRREQAIKEDGASQRAFFCSERLKSIYVSNDETMKAMDQKKLQNERRKKLGKSYYFIQFLSIGQFAFMYASTAYICLLNKEEVGSRKKRVDEFHWETSSPSFLFESKQIASSVGWGSSRAPHTLCRYNFFPVVM